MQEENDLQLELHHQLKIDKIRRDVKGMSKVQLEELVVNLVTLDFQKTKLFMKIAEG